MSFNYYARKARDPEQPIGIRLSALGFCLLHFGRLTRQRRSVIIAQLAPWLGNKTLPKPTEIQILNALTNLERERNRFLERLRAFDSRRIREKARGRRVPSRIAVIALYEERNEQS